MTIGYVNNDNLSMYRLCISYVRYIYMDIQTSSSENGENPKIGISIIQPLIVIDLQYSHLNDIDSEKLWLYRS